MKKQILTITAIALLSSTAFAQGKVGVNTTTPATTFHIDGKKDNTNTTPDATQVANDVVVTSDGRIGVGMLNPTFSIHTKKNLGVDGYINCPDIYVKDYTNNNQGHIRIYAGDGTATGRIQFLKPDNTILGGIGNDNAANSTQLNFMSNGGHAFWANAAIPILSINPTTATRQVWINGIVEASHYYIGGGVLVADYVFQKHFTGKSSLKPSYRFMTLQEVEAFTKANHHLPGYKSAAEVQKDGSIDISQNTLTNMEKIEELFLHAIELEKALRQAQGALRQAQGDNAEMKTALRQAQGDNAEMKSKMNELLKRVEQLEKK